MKLPLNSIDRQRLEVLAAILIRCFLIATIAQLFVWGVLFLGSDAVYQMQSSLLNLPIQQLPMFTAAFLTFIKCLSATFFLFPWLAIRLVLRTG